MPKNAEKYECLQCNFICSKESNYNKHLLTSKHKNRTNRTEKPPKNANLFVCECGKEYKARNSLWYHKKKCTFANNSMEEKISDKEEIEQLINTKLAERDEKHNKTTQMLLEQNNKLIEKLSDNVGSKTINNINNVNTINMNYNVNVFLNDQCKDAINLVDFVNNVQCQLKDLENVGKIGYVDGISQIFIDNLSIMDVDKRPIHCTDLKRKSMYIKDNNEWKKDDNNTKVKEAIGKITKKNIDNIDKWRLLHIKSPHDSNQSRYRSMCNESLIADDDGKHKEKILKNIGDAVPLDKGVIKTTIEEISMDEKIE
jgi:hypothetical protein